MSRAGLDRGSGVQRTFSTRTHRTEHEARQGSNVPGFTVLLTGLPSAGRTTLASAAVARLMASGSRAEELDGDILRRELWPELGLSRTDREKNLHRLATVARSLARNGRSS